MEDIVYSRMIKKLEWITIGGTIGGLIYYTMVHNTLNSLKTRSVFIDNLLMNIELKNTLLRDYLLYSILLGGWVGYTVGNLFNIIRRID